MTLHGDQDALYTAMKARWVEVDKAAKEWTVKLAELSQMWSKQTGKEGEAGHRVNLGYLIEILIRPGVVGAILQTYL